MLTPEEEQFIVYWEANRIRRKKVFRQLAVGLPLAVALVVAILINFFSGWYKRADAELRSESQSSRLGLLIVLMVAILLIVAFIVVFSVRHKWDMYEQHYLELKAKRDAGRTDNDSR
jgi:heme/copper-type cytochrome/quinol oxidase subunit 2